MKKVCLIILVAVLLIGALFIPIPQGPYRDGGTREYKALLYKKVEWKRQTEDELYRADRWYWFPKNFQSLNTLWKAEEDHVLHRFVAKVVLVTGDKVVVQPVEGEPEQKISTSIQIDTANLEDIGA